ncbi:glycoside hydrolase family 99-like domain-containing protein [Agrobacterium rosae]|uniref:glycoside hydrolase family 99-like domain-containing protein n=1 Tax=Agrobacterium rosae TaxID=1972867 RepID=UPI0015E1A9BD|nr:glycoside hydrolase family 99-like domain-containing protein [Agrobacterium rosae]
MLIPDGLETVERHRPPKFPIMLYDQSLKCNLPFKSGELPDLIHAWTPREHVRKITTLLVEKYKSPYILHMEDNEEKIVNDELVNMSFSEISKLPRIYQDLITSEYRSHPSLYRKFAEGATGYTCLIDRLLEFKPDDVPGAVFWAGYDPEFELLPDQKIATRRKYKILPDEVVILYSGNVHNSIARDIRKLYLAVGLLRSRGFPVRLVRTGWDHAPLGIDGSMLPEFVTDLGFVDRNEIPSLLSVADILVQPGVSDEFNDYRFPSKLPEYLVSGKPVILPDSNIGRSLKDGVQAIKLYDGSLSELSSKIQSLLEDKSLGAKLGRESRTFALENLSWSRAADVLEKFYSSILAGDRKTQSRPNSIETLNHPVKVISFYLPQFHPIQENDDWWGKGFTEWRNVAKAKPQMYNHRHPRITSELGYYDLRRVESMHEQAALATEYAIGGFCFYTYWFEGKRLLEQPLDLWLAKGPDFPFCICWANENWSRRWDGSESEILISQEYDEGFEERFIIDMLPYLKDNRYICVDGAPVLAIYRVSEFPDPVASAARFRSAARTHGIPNIHLTMIQSFGLLDPRPYGFDAAVEFSPPHVGRLLLEKQRVGGISPDFEGYLEDYVGVANNSINALPTDYVRYRGCFPMWDNTARRGNKGHVFINDSPKAYAHWLRFLVNEAMLRKDQNEPLVFINAWNEWAEGAYLEPDDHSGRDLLEVTRAAICYGVAEYAKGSLSDDDERSFTNFVARIPRPS